MSDGLRPVSASELRDRLEMPVHQTEVEAALASLRGEESRPPDSDGDMAFVRPMLQGMLAGTVLKWVAQQQGDPGGGGMPLKIADIEIIMDSDADYLPYFVVVTESGLRLRVTVEGES